MDLCHLSANASVINVLSATARTKIIAELKTLVTGLVRHWYLVPFSEKNVEQTTSATQFLQLATYYWTGVGYFQGWVNTLTHALS